MAIVSFFRPFHVDPTPSLFGERVEALFRDVRALFGGGVCV